MILGLTSAFTADRIEQALPDAACARALLDEKAPHFLSMLEARRAAQLTRFSDVNSSELARYDDAICLGLAHFGSRHGRWGSDFHHYHNEHHAQEILFGRIDALIERHGQEALPLQDWLALELFAVGHDLRQREGADFSQPVGRNEAASVAETFRILDACGFDREHDRPVYIALELMIAGSTFDPRPSPEPAVFNAAEVVTSGGALAPDLPKVLAALQIDPGDDPDISRGLELALIAADLDTANVGEPFSCFAESSSRLCREREMLAGRRLDSRESGQPCLRFLTDGQIHYFFTLHRFHSALGSATFDAAKQHNGKRLTAVCDALRSHFQAYAPHDGNEVLVAFSQRSLEPSD